MSLVFGDTTTTASTRANTNIETATGSPPHWRLPGCDWCTRRVETNDIVAKEDRVLGRLRLCSTCAAVHEVLEVTRWLPERVLHDTSDLLLVVACFINRLKQEARSEQHLRANIGHLNRQVDALQRQISNQEAEIQRLQERIAELQPQQQYTEPTNYQEQVQQNAEFWEDNDRMQLLEDGPSPNWFGGGSNYTR